MYDLDTQKDKEKPGLNGLRVRKLNGLIFVTLLNFDKDPI